MEYTSASYLFGTLKNLLQSRKLICKSSYLWSIVKKVTQGASILGMFIIGALVQRWVSINFKSVVSVVDQAEGAYINWKLYLKVQWELNQH